MGGLVTLTIFESTAPQVVKGSLLKSADVKSTLLKELKALGVLGGAGGVAGLAAVPGAIGATLGAPVGLMTAADALPDSIIDSVGAHMAGGAAAGYAAPVGAGLAAALMYKLKLLGNADKGYRISRGLAGMSGGAAAAGIPAWHGVSSLFKDHYRDSGKTEGSRFRDAWFNQEEDEAEPEGLEKKSNKLKAVTDLLGLTKPKPSLLSKLTGWNAAKGGITSAADTVGVGAAGVGALGGAALGGLAADDGERTAGAGAGAAGIGGGILASLLLGKYLARLGKPIRPTMAFRSGIAGAGGIGAGLSIQDLLKQQLTT
jgi:hypothetical protein